MSRYLIGLFAVCFVIRLYGQEDTVRVKNNGDFKVIESDSIIGNRIPVIEELQLTDSLKRQMTDSLQSFADTTDIETPRGDIETTINYNSQDSIFFDMTSQSLVLYGDSHIDYGSITLEAEQTTVHWYDRLITSTYGTDTAGRKIGKPVFAEGTEVYETDHIVYNFNTKRAIIKGVITEQEGAFMHGDDVKKNEKDEMFIRGARYTTCNLAHPHFYIESQKLKVIPGNQVVSGPFNLRFRELKTPLWFPFGLFPQPKKKTSGIIFPTFGEERRRGFFIREAGYYWAISDFADLRVTGDLYSKGSSAINVTSNYFVRYKFRGALNVSYLRNASEDAAESTLDSRDFWVRWNHTPQTRGNSSFSASVTAGSSSYNNNNNVVNQSLQQSISSRFTSNVSYTQKFAGTPFNMSLNARHNQNVANKEVTISLPEMTLNMNRIYPLKSLAKSNNSFISKLNMSYNFVAKNELTNKDPGTFTQFEVENEVESDDTLLFKLSNWEELLKRSKIGGRHQIPINTSISLLKRFTLNPNFNYEELWYPRELQYTYLEETQTVRVDTVDGFSRANSWRTGASLNTIIYGTYFLPGNGKIKAIRHVLTPSMSFSYNPDFGDPSRGVYQDVQVDSTGRTTRVSKYQGFAYGSPSGFESKTVGFSLQNNLEIKVADKNDTTGLGTKKIKIFDNLSISSGYNFAVDSFNLNNINFSTRTSFFQRALSIQFRGTIDPYTYILISETENPDGSRTVRDERIDVFAWNSGNGLGNLSSLSTNVTLNLRPKGKNGERQQELNPNQRFANPGDPLSNRDLTNYQSEEGTEEEVAFINNNPDEYVDFNIPWSLNVNYNISRTQRGFQDARINQTLSFGGDLTITPKTKINVRSGYDLQQNQFTTTTIGITRDLHCWTLRFNWTPFGRFQQFGLTIRPKSGLLQDLKLERRKNFNDFFN